LTLVVGACATTSGDLTDPQPEQPQRSIAIVTAERQAGDPAGTTAQLGARFVQYSRMSPAVVLDLLGTPPLPGAASGCSEHTDPAGEGMDDRAEARLFDVGPIEVRTAERVVQLWPRRFPDLYVASGVIYASDAEGEMPGGDWRFSAPGSGPSRMGAFEVDVPAPEDLTGVTVADQPLAPGGTVTVPRAPFSVRWVGGDRDDTVAVTFDGGGGERSGAVSCVARDEGSLDLDASWAERVAGLSRAGGSITVRRLRARPFVASQVESAQVVFASSIRGHLAAE
jgi:hypothetical protein